MRPEQRASRPPSGGLRPVLVVVDVDGVTSPVHGGTAWTDDIEVGDVFGPVVVSPALVAHLDALDTVPGVTCLWLTDWTPKMRARMQLFPGRNWPRLKRGDQPAGSRSWWKFAALHAWLTGLAANLPKEEFFGSLVWLDDDLDTLTIRAACQRLLRPLGLETLLVAPRPGLGVTPAEMVRVGEWVKGRVGEKERHRLDEAWRVSPVAPCGCTWDGWHCPHCGSVADPAGDAWHPAHTLRCHPGCR